jgi:glutaminyl-peptide cyclotransferase
VSVGPGLRHGLAALVLPCLAACSGCQDGPRPKGEPLPQTPALTRPAELPPGLGARAMEHVRALVAFGARHPGSPGWQRAVDYIAAQVEALGLPARRDPFRDPVEDLDFQNLSTRIPGGTERYLVLGAHHDTKITHGHDDPAHNFPFVGANDSASGVGLLLALAEYWRDHPPPATVELAFFDGEESIPFKWNLARALFGSRRYVAEYQRSLAAKPAAPRIGAMILLDMVAATDLHIDDDSNSDRELKAIVRAAAVACGHERHFFANSLAVTDDHLPFRDAGIPVIDLIDLADNPQWHTPQDTLEHLSATSLQIVGEVVLTALPAIAARHAPRESPAAPKAGTSGR